MRIIIESEERAGTSVQTFMEPSRMEVMDGGTPPASLLQLMAVQAPQLLTPGAQPVDVMDAGPLPQWLVEAIQGATPPRVEVAGGDINAGAAPSTEA